MTVDSKQMSNYTEKKQGMLKFEVEILKENKELQAEVSLKVGTKE